MKYEGYVGEEAAPWISISISDQDENKTSTRLCSRLKSDLVPSSPISLMWNNHGYKTVRLTSFSEPASLAVRFKMIVEDQSNCGTTTSLFAYSIEKECSLWISKALISQSYSQVLAGPLLFFVLLSLFECLFPCIFLCLFVLESPHNIACLRLLQSWHVRKSKTDVRTIMSSVMHL